jgi:hypothetical protein
MCFGLFFGPQGLDNCLNAVLNGVSRTHGFQATCLKYVDDILLYGKFESLPESARILLAALKSTGFDVSKKKFKVLSAASSSSFLESEMSKSGMPNSVSNSAKYLGVDLSFSDDNLEFSCSRKDRFQEGLKILRSVRDKPTKRAIFGLAGICAYDVLKQHVHGKFIADTLRSLIGKCFSKLSWSENLDLSKLDSKKRQVFNFCLHEAEKFLQERDCKHSSREKDSANI